MKINTELNFFSLVKKYLTPMYFLSKILEKSQLSIMFRVNHVQTVTYPWVLTPTDIHMKWVI